MQPGLEEILRIEGGRVLATLIRMTRDFDVAEEALQEATIEALEKWGDELPDNPAAWLTTVGKRKALDRIRRESRRSNKESESMRLLDRSSPDESGIDDRLRLIFTCCHPALSPETQVALTLRTIGGLTTSEIASAFLVPEPTMGQRISRAKKKIKVAAIPYRVPEDSEMPARLEPVLLVLYLIFTTGHQAPTGRALSRVDLGEEAIRLGRLLAELMPDEPEVHGLLGLMLATDARRPGRVDERGGVLLLEGQDRSLWDREMADEAELEIELASRTGKPGPYALQAAISMAHTRAPTYEDTQWEEIVGLYRALFEVTGSSIVLVNRAIAESKLSGSEAGLAFLDQVSGLDTWHLYWSTRAALLTDLGRLEEAVEAYDRALACEMNNDDRELLEARRATLLVDS